MSPFNAFVREFDGVCESDGFNYFSKLILRVSIGVVVCRFHQFLAKKNQESLQLRNQFIRFNLIEKSILKTN